MAKYQLEIWEEVEAAIADTVRYYQPRNKSLDFLADLDEKLEWVFQNPYGYQVRFKDIRSVKLKDFPFVILYRIEGTTIQVLDLVHSHSAWMP